jgi:hypothetical protein
MFCTNREGFIRGNKVGKSNFANPTPVSLRKPCNLNLSKNDLPYGGTGNFQTADLGVFKIPGEQPQNWNEGIRYHTLWGESELTAFYYNDNTNQGTTSSLKWKPYTNLFDYDTPAIQIMGITADRTVPLPESIAEHLPMVFRGEMNYMNHRPYIDMRPTKLSTRRFSDQVNWMVGLDLTNAYAPWLTSTGDLTANFEIYDQIMMDHMKTSIPGTSVSNPLEKNQISMLANAGTSFYYGDIAPTFTGIYAPKGKTVLLFPSVTLNPPWTKKYFMKLRAIEIMGSDNLAPEGGYFKGESMLTAEFQYNFDIM